MPPLRELPRPRLTLRGPESATTLELGRALALATPDFVRLGCSRVPEGAEAEELLARHRQEHGSERERVARAVVKRRLEFVTARELARNVVGNSASIGQGPLGEPIWPAGVVGSITHSHGLVVVAVAESTLCRVVGVDLEPDQPLGAEIAEMVERPDEIRRGDRRVFAAKEAYYKAHCSLHHRILDFADVRVEELGADGWRAAEISAGQPASAIEGRWIRVAGWLAAICWLV